MRLSILHSHITVSLPNLTWRSRYTNWRHNDSMAHLNRAINIKCKNLPQIRLTKDDLPQSIANRQFITFRQLLIKTKRGKQVSGMSICTQFIKVRNIPSSVKSDVTGLVITSATMRRFTNKKDGKRNFITNPKEPVKRLRLPSRLTHTRA